MNVWACLRKFRRKCCDGNMSFPNMLLTKASSGTLLRTAKLMQRNSTVLACVCGLFVEAMYCITYVAFYSVADVEEAISGRIEGVEDYPDDKYGPSCLILGFTRTGRPLHLQCSYPSRPLIKVITLYEPDPDLWVDFRIRKQNQRGGEYEGNND